MQVKCQNAGCTFNDLRRVYDESHKDTCEYRIVSCDKCQNTMAFKNHAAHYATCNDKKCMKCRRFYDLKDFDAHGDPCDLCKNHILCGELPNHKATECGEVPIPCKHCKKQVLRKEENTHEAICTWCNQSMLCSGRLAHQENCPEKNNNCKFCLKVHKLKETMTHETTCPLCNMTHVCVKHEEHKTNDCLNRYVKCTSCDQSIMFKSLNPGPEEHRIMCTKCKRYVPCSTYANHTELDCNNMSRCRKCLQDVTTSTFDTHTVPCALCNKNFGCTEYYTTHFKSCEDGYINCSSCHKQMKRKEHANIGCGGVDVKKPTETKKEELVKKSTSSGSSSSTSSTTRTTAPDPAILAKIENKQFDASTHSYLASNYVKLAEPISSNKVRERIQIPQDKIAEFFAIS